MKFWRSPSLFAAILAGCLVVSLVIHKANGDLVKMCLYYKVAGHARTDPILSQECVSDHVHTFYGPQLFHPRTTSEDLRNSDPKYSTSVYEENKSLYWHPTIYKVGRDASSGEPTYTRAEVSFAGPYYRWDNEAPSPKVEAFPKDFQMIAGMDKSIPGLNLFSECLCPKPCTREDGLCESESDFFPSSACGEMGIAMAFPTCWDDSKGLGDTGDHSSHMAYTLDGTVGGVCPEGYNRRLPQIQLFVRISNYEGGYYTFSDNTLPGDEEVFHADFMNGWDEGVLENIVNTCEPLPGEGPNDYNPPCTCDQFLTRKSDLLVFDTELGRNDAEAAKICPIDVRGSIVDEDTFFGVGGLPRGSCSTPVIEGIDPPFVDDCGLVYTPNNFDEGACEGESGDSEDQNEDEDTEDSEEEEEEEEEEENEVSPDNSQDSEEEEEEEEEESEASPDNSQDSEEEEEEEEEESEVSPDNSQDSEEEEEGESENSLDNSSQDNEDEDIEEESENSVDSDIEVEDDEEEESEDSGNSQDNESEEENQESSDGDEESKDDTDNSQDDEQEEEENDESNNNIPDEGCFDEAEFRFRNKEKKNCAWVQKRVQKKGPKFCNKAVRKKSTTKIKDVCKLSCGICA